MWYIIEKIIFSGEQRKHRRWMFLMELFSSLYEELNFNDIEVRHFCYNIVENQSFRYRKAELYVSPFHPNLMNISFKRISLFRKKYEITFFTKKKEELVGETFYISL